ncbi:hypothetical protein [Acinetobacter nectaris]|uniref:hypothetical protein n=1 Tax=Acinetobacter nectaris TaxID=1219382 RepID=UPI001F2D18F1|nr:hypothetical protein [Acinetobacter nectaris]MCF9045977.1 hypothetical protein [Acinetobacter nectaris]
MLENIKNGDFVLLGINDSAVSVTNVEKTDTGFTLSLALTSGVFVGNYDQAGNWMANGSSSGISPLNITQVITAIDYENQRKQTTLVGNYSVNDKLQLLGVLTTMSTNTALEDNCREKIKGKINLITESI